MMRNMPEVTEVRSGDAKMQIPVNHLTPDVYETLQSIQRTTLYSLISQTWSPFAVLATLIGNQTTCSSPYVHPVFWALFSLFGMTFLSYFHITNLCSNDTSSMKSLLNFKRKLISLPFECCHNFTRTFDITLWSYIYSVHLPANKNFTLYIFPSSIVQRCT